MNVVLMTETICRTLRAIKKSTDTRSEGEINTTAMGKPSSWAQLCPAEEEARGAELGTVSVAYTTYGKRLEGRDACQETPRHAVPHPIS